MFSSQQFDTLVKKAMTQLNANYNNEDCDKEKVNKKEKKCDNDFNLTPDQILVISGILGGVLSVHSLLVDKKQQIQIILTGSLKRKTALEKIMDEIGKKPFDEVLKAMLGRL